MIFLGCLVVGLCGFDFVVEGAEVDALAVDVDSSTPALRIEDPEKISLEN